MSPMHLFDNSMHWQLMRFLEIHWDLMPIDLFKVTVIKPCSFESQTYRYFQTHRTIQGTKCSVHQRQNGLHWGWETIIIHRHISKVKKKGFQIYTKNKLKKYNFSSW